MPDDAGLGVAVDVGLPLPARGVRVPGTDVLGLEALELLLCAELVGHFDLCVEGDLELKWQEIGEERDRSRAGAG